VYLQKLVAQTRQSRIGLGLSTRAAQGWLHVARAIAFLDGRDHVLIEDIQKTAVPVMSHRILPHANYEKAKVVANEIIQETPVL
jgi:MoxR-like ATPase